MLPQEQRPPVEADDGGADEAGIGARVDAVFVAAEKAASHILELAREEADEIRRQARIEADEIRQQLRDEGKREADRLVSDGEARAETLLAEARQRAQKIDDDGRIRQARLREETRLLEERIEWAREGLREVTLRLGQVFVAPEPAASDEDEAEPERQSAEPS